MKGFLKCYYGYKNWGDELLFFGVVRYIFPKYNLTHLFVEVGNLEFMTRWMDENKKLLGEYYDKITFVEIGQTDKYNFSKTLKFFGGGEVLTDEIEIGGKAKKDKKTEKAKKDEKIERDKNAEKKIDKSKTTISLSLEERGEGGGKTIPPKINISKLNEIPTVDDFGDAIEKVEKSKIMKFLQNTLNSGKRVTSKYFARAGRNYYIKYYKDIQKGNFVLLGGITTPNKLTTKLLYNLLLPKAKEIICRDRKSFELVKKYNKNVELYDDFGRKTITDIETDISVSKQSHSPYILINIHKKIRNENTKNKIVNFCKKHTNCQKIYFPADINHDMEFFEILKDEIGDIALYNWTTNTILETISLFKNAKAGIGARLHFLIPLQEFNISFEPIVYAEKINKLVLDKNKIELLKENKKGKTYRIDDFKICYRNKGSISGDNDTSPEELVYLISGEAKITIKKSEKIHKSPSKIIIPTKTYHKIEALTDVSFILKD